MTAICQRARAAHRWSPGCRGGTAVLLSSSSMRVWVGRGQGAGCGVALAGPWLLCPAAPHPSAPRREALPGPAVRGLAAERGPAARPGSWAGSTVPRCWQHPAEAGSHAEVCGGSWPGHGGIAGLAPRTGSPGAAPLTPAMGCESRGRHGQLICLCQEPAQETVLPKRGGDSSGERVLDTTPLPSPAQDRAATWGAASASTKHQQHGGPTPEPPAGQGQRCGV